MTSLGVTFVVGNENLWGDDALDMVLDYLRDPDESRDFEMRRIERITNRCDPAPKGLGYEE